MSHHLSLNPWQERRARAIEEARARQNEIHNFNAHWFAQAEIVRAKEKKERESTVRGHTEMVSDILKPGFLADMIHARSQFAVPALGADQKLPARFCWMPKGYHQICAGTSDGGTWSGVVICDEAAANAVIASFAKITRNGWRAFIDFSHHNEEAAAWVFGFNWDPGLGITCSVEWTTAGEKAVRDRIYTSFSPTFGIDFDSGLVSGLFENMAVGALTNTPAFGLSMPPILATANHQTSALICRVLTRLGRPQSTVDEVSKAVTEGASAEVIGALIKYLP